jgi:hypothetical protein
MPPNLAGKTGHGQDAWWDILRLIAGLDATATQKFLLVLVLRHTNKRKGYGWASQQTLAWEMNTDTRTVQRAFQWATESGIVRVERIRKAKSPTEQVNHYSLDVERMKLLQRQREHPTPTSGDKAHEHTTPVSGDSAEHTTNRAPNTRHFKQGTHDTSVVGGFEVSGNEDSGDEKARALHSARKTAAPQSGLATQPENRPRVSFENSSEPEPFDFPSTDGEQRHLRSEADQHGWTREELKSFLRDEFNVKAASHLTHRQYLAALRFIEQAVPLPPGLRNLNVH